MGEINICACLIDNAVGPKMRGRGRAGDRETEEKI